MLQKNNLKLDGMFDGVAVVFHQDAVPSFGGKTIHQRRIRNGFPKRRRERLSSQAQPVRLTVVRRSQNDEGSLPVTGGERCVGGAIGFHSAEGADMRRGDGERSAVVGFAFAAVEIAGEGFRQLGSFPRISGACVRWLAL